MEDTNKAGYDNIHKKTLLILTIEKKINAKILQDIHIGYDHWIFLGYSCLYPNL